MAKMPLESEKIKITSTKSEVLELSSSQSFSRHFREAKIVEKVCSDPLDPDVVAIMTGPTPTSRLMASVSDMAVDVVVLLDALGALLASNLPSDLDPGWAGAG